MKIKRPNWLFEDNTVNELHVASTIGSVEPSIESVVKILDKYEIDPGA